MQNKTTEPIKKRIEIIIRYFSRRKGFIFRCLFCWLIGCLVLSNDEIGSYDQRFQLRGDQKYSSDIVILTIRQNDFAKFYDRRTNFIGNLDQISDVSDSFFWNKQIWVELLTKILSQNPKSIGITLYFGENIGGQLLSPQEQSILFDPRVFWSATVNSLDRTMYPLFSNSDRSNFGSNEIDSDDDGVVRHVYTYKHENLQLAEKLSGKKYPDLNSAFLINYRGSHVFAEYSMSEILFDELSPDALKNKIIIIGAETNTSHHFVTPIGYMNRSEIIAHETDNLLHKRWIKRLHWVFYSIGFLALVFLSVFLITQYPQSVALIFMLWIATFIAAFSAWSFDTFYFWIPAFSPFVLLSTTWIVFVGYQATRIEKLNFHLKQEQKYIHELEQLKNNFVSLISHDLKTPIAKIQAITDRLLMQHAQSELTTDLKSLRTSSDELNKYIQSILKVLRVESRDFKINKAVADINELIDEAFDQVYLLAKEKNIKLEKKLEPLFSLEFDPILIKEVIINLLDNAIKYTPEKGFVRISSYEENDWVVVQISDTGAGIKSEDSEKIWQKFTRGSDQDLKTKGSGLGLYLVKYFIELHGGKVRLESQPQLGTTVSFYLPIYDESISESNDDNEIES